METARFDENSRRYAPIQSIHSISEEPRGWVPLTNPSLMSGMSIASWEVLESTVAMGVISWDVQTRYRRIC